MLRKTTTIIVNRNRSKNGLFNINTITNTKVRCLSMLNVHKSTNKYDSTNQEYSKTTLINLIKQEQLQYKTNLTTDNNTTSSNTTDINVNSSTSGIDMNSLNLNTLNETEILKLIELSIANRSTLSLSYILNNTKINTNANISSSSSTNTNTNISTTNISNENTLSTINPLCNQQMSQSILGLIYNGSVQDSKYIRRAISTLNPQLVLEICDFNKLIAYCVSKNHYSVNIYKTRCSICIVYICVVYVCVGI